MTTFWMKTVNTEKALESHISEILETLDKDYHDWWLPQMSFFKYGVICGKFQNFFKIFKTFRN